MLLLVTAVFGAANDNVFKSAMAILVFYVITCQTPISDGAEFARSRRTDNESMVMDAVSVTCITLGPHLKEGTVTNRTLHEERL